MKALSCLFIALISLLYQEVDCIQCYNCNSQIDIRCATKHIPDYLKVNCSALSDDRDYIMCRTVYIELDFSVDNMPNEKRVLRECGWSDTKYLGRCHDVEGLGGRQKICSCTEDFCNSGAESTHTQVLFYILVSSIIALICH